MHGLFQALEVMQFWAPCYEQGFTSAACQHQEFVAALPWWLSTLWPWLIELGLAITLVVLCARQDRRLVRAGVAGILVFVSNPIFDSLVTPGFNGGHTSPDAPPGTGLFGAGALVLAGLLYATLAVRQPSPHPATTTERAGDAITTPQPREDRVGYQ